MKLEKNQDVFIQGLNKYGRVIEIDTNLVAGVFVELKVGGSVMAFTHDGMFTKDIFLVACEKNVLAHPNYLNIDVAIMNLNAMADYLAETDLQLAHDALEVTFKRIRHEYATDLTTKFKSVDTDKKP